MKKKDKFVSSKRSQEEMIGFALIIIIVAVILLVFLGISLRQPQKETVESYEVDSFIQAFLQYTSDCKDNIEYLPIQKLVFRCIDNEECADGRDACDVLNSTLTEIGKESWKIEEGRPLKGFDLEIISEKKTIISIKEGNITKNSRGSSQDFFKAGNSVEITFKAYY